ncbi:MAG: UDP-galactopyranose mutase [Chloroflexi bacterium]|jgi:UDP-galactopyranose mutase|nr:UDP-galactopyranose mutase [Chloroflexota bacterium]
MNVSEVAVDVPVPDHHDQSIPLWNVPRVGFIRDYDVLVVGAGFAGAVIAERLASQAGKRVLVCDRRPHIAGNAYDHHDEAGILVHKYGPHIFHTNAARVVAYLSQFTEWHPYSHRVLAQVDGKLLPMPISRATVNELYGLDLRDDEACAAYFASVAEPVSHVRTSEDIVVSKVGRDLYEKFVRNYTRKQWGLDPSELDSSVLARIAPRTNEDVRYFTDSFQAMPRDGFTAMFSRMLAHPNITVRLGSDYRELVDVVPHRTLVYTGPIDEFFGLRFGKLPYRSLEFRHETLPVERAQPVAVVNYPNDYDYTRRTEFKYLTGQAHPMTSVVYEFPRAEGDPYYPVPRPENTATYRKYKELADETPDTFFAGRLATYRYLDMHQVVGQALAVFQDIVETPVGQPASSMVAG